MKDFSKNFIHHGSNIVEAMKKMGEVPETLTLFVIDDTEKLVGTLTDGDIRRAFINGKSLDQNVSEFMFTQFTSVYNNYSVEEFKKARDFGIRLLPVLDSKGRIEKIIDTRKRKSNLPLEALIMAGGRGERLQPLTNKTPKPMLMLGDKPILEHNIDRLIEYGITKIHIAVKYLGQQIVDYFGDGSSKGISIEYIWEDKPLGTAGAISMLKNVKTDYLLLMNSDLFTDADFEDLYLQTLESNAELGAASVSYSVKVPYGIFTENNKKITGLKEKPTITSYANSGIYILHKKLFGLIPPDTFFNITDVMNLLIEQNRLIIHNPIIGYWIDIGQHQDYENAKEIVKHIK